MVNVSRHVLGTSILAISLLIGTACASAAAPTPTAALAKPAATTAPAAKPAATASPAAKPAATASSAAKPATSPAARAVVPANWQAKWEEVLAAARKEGKVVVNGPVGDAERAAATSFTKAYPDIGIEYVGGPGATRTPKMIAERKAGIFLYDVYIGGTGSGFELIDAGALDKLPSAFILPDSVDDSKWHSGFANGFIDEGAQYLYGFLGYLSFGAQVNRKFAPKGELDKLDELLDAKWKGKIAFQDPRLVGSGQNTASTFLIVKGEDWYRKLLAQDVDIFDPQNARAMVEGLIRGQYVVAIATRATDMESFKAAGLLEGIEDLDPDDPGSAQITGGTGHVALFNDAPHPNAARVFINWLLSKQGQEAYITSRNLNSRRLDTDVMGPPETQPRMGVRYLDTSLPQHQPLRIRSTDIAKEVLMRR